MWEYHRYCLQAALDSDGGNSMPSTARPSRRRCVAINKERAHAIMRGCAHGSCTHRCGAEHLVGLWGGLYGGWLLGNAL